MINLDTWVFLMKQKSNASDLIKAFVQMVENQFNAKIKCIRSDNGLEFKQLNFCSSKGILHRLSCVETPQQN